MTTPITTAKPPIPQTLLPLLEKLLDVALAGPRGDGAENVTGARGKVDQVKAARMTAVRVKSLRLDAAGITLHLSLEHFPSSGGGGYPLRLKIEETTPEHTLCAVELPAAPGLQKVLGLGLKVLPDRIVNEALANFFQGALAMEGDKVRIDHRALLELLKM